MSTNSRHLVGSNGVRFLVQSDASWFLIARASQAEAVTYLTDRAARKFNAINVLLINRMIDYPPNFYGEKPFVGALFGTPNEAYFAHADYVISQAAQRGIIVLLAPAWLGSNGGDEGFYEDLQNTSTAVLRDYGRFLGQRYRNHDNIIWVEGGDFSPPNKNPTLAIAEGIKEADPAKLHTAHCSRNTGAYEVWGNEPWLRVNTAYGQNDNIVELCTAEYQRPQTLPFFLIEAYYENQWQTTVLDQRLQAYQALLSGACGQGFGSFPAYSMQGAWESGLNSPGAQSMTFLWNLFNPLRWDLLVPDLGNTFLTAGVGTPGVERAAAAVASNGSFGLIYAPSPRTFSVNLSRLAGPNVSVRWYNPATGDFSGAASTNPPAAGNMNFSTPAGNPDWALLLESTA